MSFVYDVRLEISGSETSAPSFALVPLLMTLSVIVTWLATVPPPVGNCQAARKTACAMPVTRASTTTAQVGFLMGQMGNLSP